MDSLAGRLRLLQLTSPEQTNQNAEAVLNNTDPTPRYLYRVYDADTTGKTDEKWANSMDAETLEPDCGVHLYDRPDREVAVLLNEHLRWSLTTSGKNNLVSWTDSLPFALTYAIFRIYHRRCKATTFDEICLCVVDTNQLPPRTFLKDMDVMGKYHDSLSSDEEIDIEINGRLRSGSWLQYGLPNLVKFRSKPDKLASSRGRFNGYNYFGEYLSQGRLKIEGACTIVSFDKLITPSLFVLYPRAESLREAKWVEPIMELRDGNFYDKRRAPEPTSETEVQAVVAITDSFEPRWRGAIAANLFAFRRRQRGDETLLKAFRDHWNILPEVSDYTQLINLGGPADYRLPEVVEFREIATDVVLREVSLIPASLREGLETQRRLLDLMKDYLSPDQFSQLYDRHLKYQREVEEQIAVSFPTVMSFFEEISRFKIQLSDLRVERS